MTGLVFEKLAQPLTAGQLWPIGIGGDFFRVEACEWPVTVALYVGGREVGRMAQVRAGDYVRDMPFEEIRVINGTVAQTVTVQIAGGGVGTDRVLGEVSVIDGGKARTLAGVAFMGHVTTSGVAGQVPITQLWNPAGSGKNVVVAAVVCSAAIQGYCNVRHSAAALLTLTGNPSSKRNGGVNSSAELRRENNAVIPAGSLLFGSWLAARGQFQYSFKEPIVLPPGAGILGSGDVAQDLAMSFEFFEDAI